MISFNFTMCKPRPDSSFNIMIINCKKCGMIAFSVENRKGKNI